MRDEMDGVERPPVDRRSSGDQAAGGVGGPPARRARSRRPLPWVWVVVVLGVALLAGTIIYRPVQRAGAADNLGASDARLIERGKYLVSVTGCNDCHTPVKMTARGPVPDLDRLLSGHPENLKLPPAPVAPSEPWPWAGSATNTAFSGPWGVTYATNLTPDKNTGTGIWTAEMFSRAIKLGKHWGQSGARAIQPPMPWANYAQMTDEDLRAIWAYLRSVPPVRNQVPDYEPLPQKQ